MKSPRLPTFSQGVGLPLRVRVVNWIGRGAAAAVSGLFVAYGVIERRRKAHEKTAPVKRNK